MIRTLAVGLVLLVLAGCKVAVLVVEGGEVHYSDYSTSETCTAGNICFHEITDTGLSVVYYAQPDPGWEFVEWSNGRDFWCPGSKNRTCELSLAPFAGIQAIEELVASDKTFYIMPVFQRIPPTVTVNGREWYQPTFFTNLSWNQINAVCPAGVCNGALNGYDVTGWTWASMQDMHDLFNHYLGREELGPGPEHFYQTDSSWAPAFFASGWRAYGGGGFTSGSHSASGWTATQWSGGQDYALIGGMVDGETGELDRAHSDLLGKMYESSMFDGAWFYRPAP